MKQNERELLKSWAIFFEAGMRRTEVKVDLSPAEIQRERARLEADPIAWIKFFFPDFALYEFAPFHRAAIRRCINNDEWFEVLSWARSLAKSTVVMFIVLYRALTGRSRNVMMASATQDSATRLLAPYKSQLENNALIRVYYGVQETIGSWTAEEFITKSGCAFRAVGAGNAPRGSRNEAVRPDTLLVDDFDTDEAVRNPDTVDKMWQWWEKALYPTRDPSRPTLVIFCGNIIARDCCITRAGQKASHWDIVNIRDRNGWSTWPQKNTEAMIDATLSKISTASQQTEYFNNPVTEGEIFKDLVYDKVPPLTKFRFLVIYGDPAPGENKTKNSSTKSCTLMGMLGEKVYVIKVFLDRGLNADFINWYIELLRYVDGRVPVYCYMENNKLQDPFFQQVFKPLVAKARREQDIGLYIAPDEERKTDKATRIEANLEPLNRCGNLILNEAERNNPHMQRLDDQFRLFTMRLKFPADGPDCVEGGLRVLKKKLVQLEPVKVLPLRRNNRRRL
jgi:hypothetical protein